LKVGVWCAISRKKIVGPIFFDNNINSSEYQKIIDQFVENLDCDYLHETFFQQDGATAHTAKNTAYQLENYFANRLISKSNRYLESVAEWPPPGLLT
jgi:hypothetical protein